MNKRSKIAFQGLNNFNINDGQNLPIKRNAIIFLTRIAIKQSNTLQEC